MDYTLSRDDNGKGKLRALTKIDLGFDNRELRIETSKGYNGGVACRASCVTLTGNGGYSHAFGLGGYGDWSATIGYDGIARATEKAVRSMHEAALSKAASIEAECRAWYAKGRNLSPVKAA